MNDDNPDPPEPQILWPCGGSPALFPGKPEEPARAPPRASDVERAARALVAQLPLVKSELRRWRVPAWEVPDLAQNVLIDVLPWWTERWLGAPNPALGALPAYVRVVARRAAKRYHRRRSEHPETLECETDQRFSPEEADAAPSAEDALVAAEARAERAAHLNPDVLSKTLGRGLWHVFHAYAVMRMPVRWIAKQEQVSIPTIYNRIHIARDALRAAVLRSRAGRRT